MLDLQELRRTVRAHRATLRLVAGAAALGLTAAAGAVALSGPWDSGQRTAERHAAAELTAERVARSEQGHTELVAGPVLDPLAARAGGSGPDGGQEVGSASGAGQPPSAAALGRELTPLLDDPALGGPAAAVVVDAATGERLFAQRARAAATPASTVKVVTAVAALETLGPDHRLPTTAVLDADADRVVLVGGADPTLTDDQLRALAERTAAALDERGLDAVRVGYDVSLYDRERRHAIGENDNIAPLTPLQVDAGRQDGPGTGPAPRSADPAGDAAEAFAGHLADAGVRVGGAAPAEGAAPAGAERLATHRSSPVSVLVEWMLEHSDNDVAEALARHVALATGHSTAPDDVARALTDRLAALDLPLAGTRLADASGLDRSGRVTADLLTQLVTLAADPARPELRPALTGMPVAGFSGTLSDRFDVAGAGVVRAKTGTLTGVNSLAGTVTTAEGRVLAFAFLASDTADQHAAQDALDRAATALAACGCG